MTCPCLFLLLFLPLAALAQTMIPSEARLDKGFAAAHYERKGDKPRVLQSIFTGESAVPVSTNEVLVKEFRMTTIADGDIRKPQLVIAAPECRLDINPRSHRITSTNRLRVSTATTNFVIEGRGFSCAQTNELLVISNSVITRLPKPSKAASGSHITAASMADMEADPANYFQVFSDRFELYYTENLVIYSGHVMVLDSNVQMRCEYLQARFNTNRFGPNTTIEKIIAERDVEITTADGGQAWGSRAIYAIKPSVEHLELIGQARWQDGPRESKADKFTFDFTPDHFVNTLRADGRVALKLPDSEIKETNLVNSLPVSNPSGDPNHFTELFADHVTVQKSPIKKLESILAEGHVVIINQFQQTRATGDGGVYTTINDQFELSGHADCQMASRGEIRADCLTLGRTNQSFSARGNSQFKYRLADIHDEQMLNQDGFNTAADTNRFLTVTSRDARVLTNKATFTGDIQACLLQGEQLIATLKSQLLELQFATNKRIQSVLAKDHVHAESEPQGRIISREFSGDLLFAHFWPGSKFLENARAEGNVSGKQVELDKNSPKQKITTLNAESVVAQFSPQSNTVENATATRSVRAMQINGPVTNTLTGEHVVYSGGTNEIIQVTGDPRIQYFGPPSTKPDDTNLTTAAQPGKTNEPGSMRLPGVLVTGADSLIWDMKTDKFHGIGPYSIVPIRMTNSPEITNEPASTNR